MKRFAFLGRVSTEDQQDPETSLNWQIARARALTERHGEIVIEFFDVGQARSIPWKRRPRAAELLELLKQPDRGFDAVVIGEPQRAFYGNQFSLTFPIFTHYGVELWVPDVGGPIDPESEAHDLIMSVFGGMSKGKRSRIKIRVRAAMAAQAQVEGRYLVEHTLTQLEAAQPDAMATPNLLQRSITECDRKLAKHRAALEAGADPAMIAAWSSDVYRERAALIAQLTAATHHTRPPQRMSRDGIRQLVDALGGLLAILRVADPGDKLEVYRELGLKLNYNHETEEVTAYANPQPQVGVLSVSGGGLEPPRPIKGTSTSS